MYTVGVSAEVIAQHFLIGGGGPENRPHSHVYRVELRLSGDTLGADGYLADIDALTAGLEAVLARYRDRTLNDLSEFKGVNPSIEHFAGILCRALRGRLAADRLREITVTVWESATAWAACSLAF